MNAFPDDYVVHNLPLIVLSGLGEEQNDKSTGEKGRTLLSEGGFRVKIELPPVKSDIAQTLLQALLSHDASNRPWHGKDSTSLEQNGVFRIHTTGRIHTLPPKKAPPPPYSPRLRPAAGSASPPPQLVLHSVVSPLTPSSPLYPDGIMTPLWITKHQSRLPSIFMPFFTLFTDPNTSTLQDNKLRSEINNIRSVFSSTSYKTKLVVVLIGDSEIDASEAEDRLINIRRGTNLDPKSLFYLAAQSSQAEISGFSKSMLNSLYPGCLEYYRELSKHARRKRNRNIVPQPTIQPTSGTSHTLPLAGWNVRYEFKLGVFAEFRQEMEAALRNYETAYEALFSAEVFETIPSWSPRFNEARMFSDILSIRIIRCILWLGQTTNAVKWWTNHRNRIRNLVDRRGAGTETYGWEAWQSVWSKTMADLIQRAQVFPMAVGKDLELTQLPLFFDVDTTTAAGQRYAPWERLHHEGYWLNIAQQHTQNRRTRAIQMPEEDRASPGQSPASMIASKAHLYDKYLALEPYKEFPLGDKPGYDYSHDIVHALDSAIKGFSDRGQAHMIEVIQLKRASELMAAQSWQDAITALHPVWESKIWRNTGWWILLRYIGRSLLQCALRVGNTELAAQLRWQLTHPLLANEFEKEQITDMDSDTASKPGEIKTALDTEHSLSRIFSTFAFAKAEGHVGETMNVQLSIQHILTATASHLQLVQVKVVFEGGLQPIYLLHDLSQSRDVNPAKTIIDEIKLEDAKSRTRARRASLGIGAALSADVDLSLSIGQIKIFQFHILPREAGDVSVASISMTFEGDEGEMTITTLDMESENSQWWEIRDGTPRARLCGRQRDSTNARILPKPPKLDIQILNVRKVFYTNEAIEIKIQSTNNEDQSVLGSIEARLLSPGKYNTVLKWKDSDVAAAETASDTVAFVQQLPKKEFEEIGVGSRISHELFINNIDEAADHELEVLINYSLTSNPETRLTKQLTIDLPIIRPFEANFSFHSRIHEESWPNFFSTNTISQNGNKAVGIKQRYLIAAVICSFAAEELIIESTQLITQKIIGEADCTITEGALRQIGDMSHEDNGASVKIRPEGTQKFEFDMTLQKRVLGSRQPIGIDLLLEIKWKQKDSDILVSSTLQVPRFLAPSAEPRVLLQAVKDVNVAGLYRLNYTIENPSLHFLTFNLTMESSDEFAFSGTKSKSLSLVPVSRHGAIYRIMSSKSKAWIKVRLEVIDAYFGQTLKIQPASEGIRIDKQGNVLVWVE